MIYVWWTLTVVLMLAGLAGTIVPVLPGTTIILAAAVLFHFTVHSTHALGWWPIGGLALLTIASYAVDLASGSIGAKWGGATKWGAIGGLVGTVVGLFFGIVGIFVAPLIGVLLGEWLSGRGRRGDGRLVFRGRPLVEEFLTTDFRGANVRHGCFRRF
jgi:uncharacterized protein YqgC (DUF456 family)